MSFVRKSVAALISISFLVFGAMSGVSAVNCQLPAQGFLGTAIWGSPQSPLIASPGSTNLPLYLSITNLGPFNLTSVNITFYAAYPLIPASGESSTLTQYVPALLAGYSIPLIGYFSVANGATPGVYSESVLVSYEYTPDNVHYFIQNQTISISVPVLGPALPAQSFQATAFWGSPQSPLIASPGSTNLPLYLSITNLGPKTVTSITVTFNASYPLIPLSGESRILTQYVPVMAAGVSIPLIGYFGVASNAAQGLYNETVQVSYYDGSQTASQTMNVSLAVFGPIIPSQSFQALAVWGSLQSPIMAAPDSSDLPLLVTVYNTGPSTVFNFTASLQPSFPLIPLSGESQNINSTVTIVSAGSSVQLLGYFNVSAAASSGIYSQYLILTYSNGTQILTQNLTVGVPILGMPDVELSAFTYTPTLIYSNYGAAQLQVVLINSGNTPASDVSLSLNTSFPVYPLYQGSMARYVGYLPVGQPVTVTFPLGIENTTAAENTTLTLHASYNGLGSSTFSIPFSEAPMAVLQVESVSSPAINIGDGSDYVTLTIQNVGSAAAQYATLTLVPSNVFQPSIPSSTNPLLATTYLNATVGTLPPGQQANVTFVVSVSPNIVAGSYPLTLVATWIQSGTTAPFVQQLILQTPVGQSITQAIASPFGNPISLLIIVLIIVLIAVAVIVIIRGRRKRK